MKGGQTQLLRWQQLAHAIVNKAIVDYSDSYISDRGTVEYSRRMMMDVRRFLKSDLFKDVLPTRPKVERGDDRGCQGEAWRIHVNYGQALFVGILQMGEDPWIQRRRRAFLVGT